MPASQKPKKPSAEPSGAAKPKKPAVKPKKTTATASAESEVMTNSKPKVVTVKSPLLLSEMQLRTSKLALALAAGARREFDDGSIGTPGEGAGTVVGVPLGSFALEYLFGNNIMPLSRVAQVVGTEGSCKTGFCAEVGRIFRTHGGLTYLFDVETKYSQDWWLSHLGWHDQHALVQYPCDSMDDWQRMLQFTQRQLRLSMDGQPKSKGQPAVKGTGRIFPTLFVIDSVMAKSLQETQDKMEEAGSAGRQHPIEALSISNFLKKMPKDMRNYPFLVLAINQLKPQVDPRTHAVSRNKAGGRSLSFQEIFEIQMKAITTEPFQRGKVTGSRIEMQLFKNSLGDNRRRIIVECCWHNELQYNAKTGREEVLQKTNWRWHKATVELLLSEAIRHKKELRQVLDVQLSSKKTKTGEPLVFSRRLGIPSTSPVLMDEAGEQIWKDKLLRKPLRELYGIATRPIFNGTRDYYDLVKAAEAKSKKQIDAYFERIS